MVIKKTPTYCTICTIGLSILILSIKGFAQQNEPTESEISSQPLWILILPGTISESADQELENEITDIVTDIAWESGRFEVFDRFDTRDMLMEYQPYKFGYLPDSVVFALGDYTECDEALLVDVVRFSQIGVPPEDDKEEEDRNFLESIIDALFSGDSDDYANNIHTRLTVQFRNLDLVNRNEIDRFSIKVSYTGGTKPESEEKALDNFRDVLIHEVRMIYQLISEVIAVDGKNLDLRLGSNLGITDNTLFEIIEPEQITIVGDDEIRTPGQSSGLVCVQNVSDTINHSLIIRQWGAIKPGDYAYEFNERIQGIQVYFLPKFPGDYMYIGGAYNYSPLGVWDFGGGIHYLAVTDSYQENDHGFGFGIYGARKLFMVTTLTVYARMGINLDIPFKKDENDKTVTTGLFSGSLGLNFNLMFTKKSDIEINLGYRLSNKSSEWTYNEQDAEYDAAWSEAPPVVDMSGFYFNLGYKFLLF